MAGSSDATEKSKRAKRQRVTRAAPGLDFPSYKCETKGQHRESLSHEDPLCVQQQFRLMGILGHRISLLVVKRRIDHLVLV
jgi:hypothetical protein